MKELLRLRQVLEQWPITPKRISSYKDVYRVEAAEGLFCLKEIDKKPRRALALEGVLEHLLGQEFQHMAGPRRSREGRLLCERSQRHYILTDWVVGRRPAFCTSDRDIVGAAATLALFHQAAQGYTPPRGGRLRDRLGRWPTRFASRLREVVKLREELRHKPFLDNFDRAYIEYYPWILDRAQAGCSSLAASEYSDLVTVARNSGGFCHGDVAQRNFVATGKGQYYLIDLDLVRRDIRVADLYKLLRDAGKKRRWDPQVVELVITGYSRVSHLEPRELSVLYALLCYPHKVIHLVLRYYVKREGKSSRWSTGKFIAKMHELGRQQPLSDRFVQALRARCLDGG